MTRYNAFTEAYYKAKKEKPKGYRDGQVLMNLLRTFDPEEYERISSVHYYDQTDIDPFYKDELIPNTLQHLKEVWK